MNECTHLELITVDMPETVEGCEECLKTGDRWMHLRVCRTCGKVGCCDSSPNRHASAHARERRAPGDLLGGAGRGVVLLLRRRGGVRPSGGGLTAPLA